MGKLHFGSGRVSVLKSASDSFLGRLAFFFDGRPSGKARILSSQSGGMIARLLPDTIADSGMMAGGVVEALLPDARAAWLVDGIGVVGVGSILATDC